MLIPLMYHGLDSFEEPSEFKERGNLIYVVNVDAFNKQMTYIAEKKIPVVTLGPCKEKKDYALMLTFDDGHITNFTRAFPILSHNSFKAYFFITSGWIGREYYMTERMIKELGESGMIIGSHGMNHRFMTDLTPEEAENELVGSKKRIEDIVGKDVTCFSAPDGRINLQIAQLARKAGYRYLFDSTPVISHAISEGEAIGRFAIRKGQSFASFASLVEGRVPFVEKVKFGVLRRMKGLLGNRAYVALRAIALGDSYKE